jgi:hypothetical protein
MDRIRPRENALWRRFAALVLAVSVTAPAVAFAARLSTPTGRLSLAPCARATRDDRLRAAILSVHAYVEKYRRDAPLKELLDHVDPMLPLDVIKILKRDESALGKLRLRRALLRYLTWVRDDPDVKRAMEFLLGADRAKALERRIAAHDAVEDERFAAGHADGSCDVENEVVDEAEQLRINAELNRELQPVKYGQCDNIQAMMASTVFTDEGVVVASKTVAKGDLETARKGIDAQRWATCSPLWGDAFLVKLDMSGNIEGNASCSVPDDPHCMPNRGPEVLPFGGSYDTNSFNRPLFEHFQCDGGWCDIRLLLRIVTQEPPVAGSDYDLEYSNPKPWKHFPYPPVDHGTVEVYAAGVAPMQTLTVKADKVFGFDDWSTDFAVYFMLRRIEMANYLADLACCNVP